MKFSIKLFFNIAVLLLLVLMAFGIGVHGSFCVLADDDASSSIVAAEDVLQQAFAAVLDAENAGANVSALLVKLDVAGRNLTEAEMDNESGRVIEAVTKAELCYAIASGVADEALDLKRASLNAKGLEWEKFVFSGVGVFVFLVVLVSVWIVFRRSYVRKLLGLRPEVGSDVEA